ncbi:cytochrome P450 [Lentzea jiangxiensis]|uniref:cytochrome P450 n=1 Tax=Lentzea jiangxiensis TaxID=641025 RepID=UPI00115FA7CD|nr:cytochrome P450 [Lentzea jiangxiensis]
MADAFVRFAGYVRQLLDMKEPGDDVITELRDEPNLVPNLVLLITAGHETTVQLIGNGLLALLRDPAMKRRVIDDPIALPEVVEELLRYDGPFATGIVRVATGDVVVGGVTIPKSSQVTVSHGAANRDPSRNSRSPLSTSGGSLSSEAWRHFACDRSPDGSTGRRQVVDGVNFRTGGDHEVLVRRDGQQRNLLGQRLRLSNHPLGIDADQRDPRL